MTSQQTVTPEAGRDIINKYRLQGEAQHWHGLV